MREFRELTTMVFAKHNRAELKRAGKQLLILLAAQFAGFFMAYRLILWNI